MLKIEEDWGDAGGVDDRFCYLGVSPDLPRKSRGVRWFTPIPDCPPFEVKPTAAFRALEIAGRGTPRYTHNASICHLSRFRLRVCDTPEKIYSPGGTDNGQFGHTHARYVFMTQNILTLCNMPVLSFLILVRNFESMVAVLSPNLRLWETFDRIYCQVLHINCPTHRLPCHSLQSTNITCESWNKKPIHPHLPRHLILTDKWIWKTMRGKHCCDF